MMSLSKSSPDLKDSTLPEKGYYLSNICESQSIVLDVEKLDKDLNINGAVYVNKDEVHFYHTDIQINDKLNTQSFDDGAIARYKCPVCHELSITYNIGCVTCQNSECGVCIGNEIDHKPEWNEQIGNRCNQSGGQNEMLIQTGYGTKISFSRSQSHIRRYQHWLGTDYKERSLKTKLTNIRQICSRNGIKDLVIEQAYDYYYKIVSAIEKHEDKKRGFNDIGLQAGSVYFSFLQHNITRSYREVAKMFKVDQKYVSDAIKTYFQYIPDYLPSNAGDEYDDCKNYLKRYLNRLLNDSDTMRNKYLTIISNLIDTVNKYYILDSNMLTSSVAGCIYFVFLMDGLNISTRQVSQYCETSHPTIHKVCKELLQHVDLLLPIIYETN